jgi:hypothetical protein
LFHFCHARLLSCFSTLSIISFYIRDWNIPLRYLDPHWSDMSTRPMSCLSDIRYRMCSNLLKMNQDKIKLMHLAPNLWPQELADCIIPFSGNIEHDTSYANILRAYFDRTSSMEMQCNVLSRSYYVHIWTLDAFVLSFRKMHACKMLVHALIGLPSI